MHLHHPPCHSLSNYSQPTAAITDMGSYLPFPDLNYSPNLPDATSSSPAADPVKTPKLEPLDEPFSPNFATPTFNFSINSQSSSFLVDSSTSNPNPNFNFPNSTPFSLNSQSSSNPNLNFTNSTSNAENSSQESNVQAEFNRIAELFNSAFETQQNADVSAQESNPLAIVIVPEETQVSCPPPPPPRRDNRGVELVRVTELNPLDEAYYRELVRRTRMVYDSLRTFAKYEEEKRRESGQRQSRADLRAASVMKDRGMWINREKRIVGEIPGIKIGDIFFFRMELCVVGLHGQAQAGIDYLPMSMSTSGEPIATSIIVSGGYEDDLDIGDEIVYTGHGGQDKRFRQCADQKLEGGNLALERSMRYGIEVRVIRGFKYEGSVSGKVYVYDGLYKIYDYWFDVGKSGFGVYKYKLARIENQPVMGSAILKYAASLRNETVRPVGYVSLDISKNNERVPVLLFNDFDNNQEPLYFDYLATSVFPAYVYHTGTGSGCECVLGCNENCHCAIKNGGEFAYDQNGILVRGKPLIFECGVNCRCPPTCRNRVSQKGITKKFEIFRSAETGWGVRSLELIQAGSFICEYAGVALTREQAQIVSMNGDGLVYPSRFSERWTEWGDLSQIFTDYVRPAYPSIPPLDFALDISKMRNVACYMSHISTPNAMIQFVLYDHNNLMFPHLMVFAMENIPPLREISLDYGADDDSVGKLRICNS